MCDTALDILLSCALPFSRSVELDKVDLYLVPVLIVHLLRCRGEAEAAREAMVVAVKSVYGQRSGDYMAGLAAVHCKRRGWEVA